MAARERDVRSAIRDTLLTSGIFGDDVWLTGLPEDYAGPASSLAAAVIEPKATTLTTGWDAPPDGSLDFTAQLTVTLIARGPDPQLRDELAEQLLAVLQDSVDGQSLAGFTLPSKTLVQSWTWQPPTPRERRIAAVVSFAYLIAWQGWETGP